MEEIDKILQAYGTRCYNEGYDDGHEEGISFNEAREAIQRLIIEARKGTSSDIEIGFSKYLSDWCIKNSRQRISRFKIGNLLVEYINEYNDELQASLNEQEGK